MNAPQCLAQSFFTLSSPILAGTGLELAQLFDKLQCVRPMKLPYITSYCSYIIFERIGKTHVASWMSTPFKRRFKNVSCVK